MSLALPGQQLLKDINTAPSFGGSSSPTGFTQAGGLAFFAASDGRYGDELHVTDATLLGTRMVRDVWPGQGGSGVRGLQATPGRVVFLASRPLEGMLPFSSDGTLDGTGPLRSDLTAFDDPVVAAGTVFLLATHPSFGRELWRTDGTALGTVLVRDIVPGPGAPQFGPMVAHAGTLVFVVTDTATGNLQLWSSDGTNPGTVLRVTLPTGVGAAPTALASDGTRVWLLGVSGAGELMWRSDLTAGGTQLVITLPPGSGASELVTVGARLFFRAFDLAAGAELWTSNGTVAGTRRVADIWPGATGSHPSSLVSLGNALYFSADDGTRGRQLWRSDAAGSVATLVRDTGAGGLSLEPGAILAHSGRLLFGASGQLWRSDGTTAGTVPVTALAEPLTLVGWIRPFGSRYLFSAQTGSVGQEPWVTDLTPAGTVLLKDVNAPPGQPSSPTEFAPLGDPANAVLFLAADSVGTHLWRSDGTNAGTVSVVPAPNGFFWLTRFGNRVLITGSFGTGLFVSDGTGAGTVEVSPGGGFTRALRPVVAGGLAFFPATTNADGEELWVTDGNAAGTRLVRDIFPGSIPSQMADLTAVGNRVFFTADDGVAGRELWVSDGTTAGTRRVVDLTPGVAGTTISEPTAVGNRLFFTTSTPSQGFEVWVSDGTAAGTRVVDLVPGVNSSVPNGLSAFQGQCYFAGIGPGDNSFGLWRSDGTLAGTVLVRNEGFGLTPSSLVASGNRLFFVGEHATLGRELWVTDGTTAGTQIVKDITPGAAGTTIDNLRSLGAGLVVLTARDPVFGAEAWRSDGSDVGTFLLADLAAGAIDSSPDQYTLVGQQVFFTADDQLIGREPYVMPRDSTGGATVESFGVGCARSGADIPRLDTTSLPRIGNANMRVVLDRAEPSSPASLLLAAQAGSTPLGSGCTLLLAPPIVLSIDFGNTTPIGTASLPLPVPNIPALAGVVLVVQAVVVQPGAPFLGLISFSQGLRLRLGQ